MDHSGTERKPIHKIQIITDTVLVGGWFWEKFLHTQQNFRLHAHFLKCKSNIHYAPKFTENFTILKTISPVK